MNVKNKNLAQATINQNKNGAKITLCKVKDKQLLLLR